MEEIHEGLPKQFVGSLKILFDILDEDHTGLIRLRDVESRWSDEGVRDLPTGVMIGLRKVAPPNGLLTFDCFVAGLKVALFRDRDHPGKPKWQSAGAGGGLTQKENRYPGSFAPGNRQQLQPDPGSCQQGSGSPSDTNKQASPYRTSIPHLQKKNNANTSRPATIAVKPQPSSAVVPRRNNAVNPHASLLQIDHHNFPVHRSPSAPPRPERSAASHNQQVSRQSTSGSDLQPPQVPPRDHRQNQKIVNELKNWQRDWASQKGECRGGRERSRPGENPHNAIYANIEDFQRKRDEPQSQGPLSPTKVNVRRHGSGRRHTLQNGVDHNMLKRMQQLEDESVMLKQGLEMVEDARDWYLRQMAALSDKQRMLGKVTFNDNSLEAHQERMNFQRARISEVNLQLRSLVESSEKGFPLHMNLAVMPVKGGENLTNVAVKMMKEQNWRLTREVNDKSEKISKLEQEKSSLIRELFEARSKHKSSYDDTTFM